MATPSPFVTEDCRPNVPATATTGTAQVQAVLRRDRGNCRRRVDGAWVGAPRTGDMLEEAAQAACAEDDTDVDASATFYAAFVPSSGDGAGQLS